MRLLWAELRDFRNHRATKLDVPPELVTVVGPNGEGKTNLLEGMYYVFSLVSPRVSSDQPLVRSGAESAFVRGEVQSEHSGRSLVEVEIRTSGANRVQVNRSPVRRKRDVRKLVRAVFFGPDDLDVVQGEPGARRRFMDEAIVTLWPAQDSLMRNYERTLRQRNRLLKDWHGRGEPAGLDVWDEELVAAGSALTESRRQAVERLAPEAAAEFGRLSGYAFELTYAPSVEGEGAGIAVVFHERLAARRDDELLRRTTLVGPHRDDLRLAVRDLGARGFASHGEAWGAALSLRLGLAAAVEAEIGETPVVLLDDPFSALDPARQQRVGEGLASSGRQVVLSVADEAHIPPASEVVWRVASGTVTAG